MEYLATGKKPVQNQIMNEIDYAMRYYNRPSPAILIAYEREACYGSADPDLRITFDRSIRYRTSSLRLDRGTSGTELLPGDITLMELKTSGAMPLWLSRAFSELNILPLSFSKYGTAYRQIVTSEKVAEKQMTVTSKGVLKNVINL